MSKSTVAKFCDFMSGKIEPEVDNIKDEELTFDRIIKRLESGENGLPGAKVGGSPFAMLN